MPGLGAKLPNSEFIHVSITQLPLSQSYRSHLGLFLIWKEKGKINIWEMALASQEEKNKRKS